MNDADQEDPRPAQQAGTVSDDKLLRRAAALMRKRAGATREPEPDASQWYGSDGNYEDIDALTDTLDDVFDTSTARADAEHIASWRPAVAIAVADWLDDNAVILETLTAPEDWTGSSHALAVAREYLGEPVQGRDS